MTQAADRLSQTTGWPVRPERLRPRPNALVCISVPLDVPCYEYWTPPSQRLEFEICTHTTPESCDCDDCWDEVVFHPADQAERTRLFRPLPPAALRRCRDEVDYGLALARRVGWKLTADERAQFKMARRCLRAPGAIRSAAAFGMRKDPRGR